MPQDNSIPESEIENVAAISQQPVAKRRKKETVISDIDLELKKIEQSLAAVQEKDEHDHFGNSVAVQLKKLTSHEAALARIEIEKVFLSFKSTSKIAVSDL